MSSGTTESLSDVWGSSGSDLFAVGQGGTILHHDGSTWNSVNSGTSAYLLGVWGSSSSDVTAVGYDGTILHYDGVVWSPMDSGTTESLYAVWGSSGSDVFAVGCGGTILHYDGTTWNPMSNGTSERLRGVWGSSGSDVFAVGDWGTILHYDGASWSPMYSDTTKYLDGVWGSSGSDVFAVGGSFDTPGIAVHYDGMAWSAMDSGLTDWLRGIWGSSGGEVVAVGDWGTILHYDGTAWSAVSSGTGNSLTGVWGSSGSNVTAMGLHGTILHHGSPDLALAKAVQPGTTVLPGEPITFTLAFSNAGTVTATGVLVRDVMPAEVTSPSYHSSRPVTPTGTVSYTWLLGDLPPGEAGMITATSVVSSGLPAGHAFTNTAIVSATMVDCCPANNGNSVRVSIQAVPVAMDDGYTTMEEIPLAVAAPGVLGNDSDLNGDPLAPVLDSPPLSGILVLNANGSFTYTPILNFHGVDLFTYHVTDAISDSNVAAVTLNVTAVNDPPLASDDRYTAMEEMPLIVAAPGVLANDGDVDGDVLMALLDRPPDGGTLTLSPDGSFIFTPALGFAGVNTFTYHASDTISESDLATVTLTVQAEPRYFVYLPLALKNR
jgi:uncharacterized repeat protein (TIGR01451 family)